MKKLLVKAGHCRTNLRKKMVTKRYSRKRRDFENLKIFTTALLFSYGAENISFVSSL